MKVTCLDFSSFFPVYFPNFSLHLQRAKQLIAEEEDDAAEDDSKKYPGEEMNETLGDSYDHDEDDGPNGVPPVPPVPPLPRLNGIPQNRQ